MNNQKFRKLCKEVDDEYQAYIDVYGVPNDIIPCPDGNKLTNGVFISVSLLKRIQSALLMAQQMNPLPRD